MPTWLAIVFIVFVSVMTGWLIIRPFLAHTPFAGDWLALLMGSVTLGSISIGLLALILVELSIYSLPLLGILLLLLVLLLALFGWRKQAPWLPEFAEPPPKEAIFINQRWEKLFLVVWLIAAAWLFFRPHQFVHGAADAGVYVNLAAQIERLGTIVYHDETFAQLDPSVQTVFARPINNPVGDAYLLPAFFLMDASTGEIQPQFYPFHPVWQGIAYSLGGVFASLLMTGLWALLSCVAIYLFVRQIAGWETGALTLIALSFSAMQVWFARYPTTEVQTQFFLWLGLWATAVWLSNRQPTSLWAFLAGSSLGVIFLIRIDVLFMLPILIIFITWFWARKQQGIVWFAVPLLLLVLHSLLHAVTQSQAYFFDLFNFAIRSIVKNQWVLVILIILGLIGLGIIVKFHQSIQNLLVRYRKPLLALAIALLLFFAIYNWFIRPYHTNLRIWSDQFSTTDIGIYNHENLLRLGWYLSPIGIWLGFLGICWMVWRVNRQTAVMLAITVFFTLFYLWNIRNNPHQIYAMRRYVPAVLPLFIVGSAYLLDTLLRKRQIWLKGLALLLIIGWLGGIIWSARGFVTQTDYVTLPEQLAQLNTQFDSNAIILFNEEEPVGVGDFVGTPLRYIFAHDVYKIHPSPEPIPDVLVDTIKSWQNNGRTIYWIGDTTWLAENNVPHAAAAEHTITTQALEGVFDRKPTQVNPVTWQLSIVQIE